MGTVTERLQASRWWRHPHVGALGLFSFVIVAVYWSVLAGARSLITNGPWTQPLFVVDPSAGGYITAPLTRITAISWLHLRLPVVDPFQGFGIPLLANQGVPVYPPQVLTHLAFPGNYSVWLVMNLVVLAFGVYLLARAFGQRWAGAVAAGFLAALAGVAPPNANMSMLNPLAVLPFVLVAVRYAVDPDSEHPRAGLLGVATSVAFLCLSGFQEVLPLFAVVIVVYTVALLVHYRTFQVRPGRLATMVASAVAGVVIGSIGLLPTLSVVNAGTSVNGTTSHLFHFPAYWLATFTLPTITGRAMLAAPLDLGNGVYVLGTPLLVLVVVLAVILALRRGGAGTRYYVVPSVVMVVVGAFAYADLGHVLSLMGIPLFASIRSNRFVEFAWWIPMCLLLGAVITNARLLRWRDVLVGLVCAAAFDIYFFVRFRQALSAAHVASTLAVAHAPIVAAGVVVVFLGALVATRWLGTRTAGLLMVAIVLASCLYDLPTNFSTRAHGSAVASVAIPGFHGTSGQQLVYFGTRQQPTEQHSVQIYGPIVPTAYRDAVGGLFSATQTTNGNGPLWGAAATLADVALTPRAVSVLRSLGVNLLVLRTPLAGPGFTSVPACASELRRGHGLVCYLGTAASPKPYIGNEPATVFMYRVLGASPIVNRARPVAVTSVAMARDELAARLSDTATRPFRTAFVTTDASNLAAARGVRAVSRHATTAAVAVTLRSASRGLVVLKEAYERGMRATVDGRAVPVLPVDGGLWTAVDVGRGLSRVVLDYQSTADDVELGLAAAGLAGLAVLWVALAASTWRRRRPRSPGSVPR